jgi:hypothetical protein
LNNIKRMKKCFRIISALVLLSGVMVTGATAASLTTSTTLTVVNVTVFNGATAVGIPTWEGDWPSGATDSMTPGYREVYLDNVAITYHSLTWNTNPYVTPYPVFPNTINSMIAALWSEDGGKTFILQSWDYLANTTHGKGLEHGMPSCWMGTFVHSVCDRKAGECNGRYKSNVYFTPYTDYPFENTACYATY